MGGGGGFVHEGVLKTFLGKGLSNILEKTHFQLSFNLAFSLNWPVMPIQYIICNVRKYVCQAMKTLLPDGLESSGLRVFC